MKFKTLALAAGLSVLATSAFADAAYTPTFDLSPAGMEATTGSADTVAADVITGMEAANGYAIANQAGTDNTALIVQDGTVNSNVAFIDQSIGAGTALGNVAVIVQDGTLTSNNAAVFQLGSGNNAVILQH